MSKFNRWVKRLWPFEALRWLALGRSYKKEASNLRADVRRMVHSARGTAQVAVACAHKSIKVSEAAEKKAASAMAAAQAIELVEGARREA